MSDRPYVAIKATVQCSGYEYEVFEQDDSVCLAYHEPDRPGFRKEITISPCDVEAVIDALRVVVENLREQERKFMESGS